MAKVNNKIFNFGFTHGKTALFGFSICHAFGLPYSVNAIQGETLKLSHQLLQKAEAALLPGSALGVLLWECFQIYCFSIKYYVVDVRRRMYVSILLQSFLATGLAVAPRCAAMVVRQVVYCPDNPPPSKNG